MPYLASTKREGSKKVLNKFVMLYTPLPGTTASPLDCVCVCVCVCVCAVKGEGERVRDINNWYNINHLQRDTPS